jgi:transposase
MDPREKSLRLAKTITALREFLGDLPGIDARLARELLEDIQALTVRANALEKEITALVAAQAPELLELPGCGPLTAAKIVGETAGVARFATEAKFAMHAGVAPIPVWSGRTKGRVRLNKAGNRQLNAALHRIAITQIRLKGSLGKAYYDKRLAAGDSTTEAIRCLKRRLARIVFTTLNRDHQAAAANPLAAAA